MTDTKQGGKVIDSGGFGCIFLPEIICKNKSKRTSKNKTRRITKMMLNRHASDEYNQIMKIKDIVKKIPNYGDYFVIKDIDICKIKKLTDEDLENYHKKCTALQKYNITKKNIRKSFDKISIVNIPYAGISLDKFIEQYFTMQKMMHFNKLMIQLLKNAIIPMNEYGVFHSDVKSSNILINESHKNVRFIDWGLTVIHPQKYFTEIPQKWKNRPLQFNVPFEIILFTDDFVKKINEFFQSQSQSQNNALENNENNNGNNKMFKFVNDYIYFWLNERGKGHINYIQSILTMLGILKADNPETEIDSDTKTFTNSKAKYVSQFAKYKETVDYISNYIVFILVNFTDFDDNGSFTLMNYINTVFKNYTDIWGFLIAYIPIIEMMNENKESLKDLDNILFYSLKKILIKYLYTPRIKLFKTSHLIKDLEEINKSLKQFSKSENQTINKTSKMNSSLTETPATII